MKGKRIQTLTTTCCLWVEIPALIRWHQSHRDSTTHMDQLLRASVNANIILLVACFVDGFLVECLKSTVRKRSDRTHSQRLAGEFYARAQRAGGFDEISSLFKVVTGKSLGELANKNGLQEAVRILFKFRNGLAHGRSIQYDTFTNLQTWSFDYEFSGSYKEVEDYLIKRRLLKKRIENGGSGWDYFADFVVDHFLNLIVAYPTVVLRGLSRKVATPVRNLPDLSTKPRLWS